MINAITGNNYSSYPYQNQGTASQKSEGADLQGANSSVSVVVSEASQAASPERIKQAAATGSTPGKQAAATQNAKANVDTVEISAQGKAALEKNQTKATGVDQPSNLQQSSKVEPSVVTKTSNDQNLSNLTEEQIQNLVSQGKITKAQAEVELAKRSSNEESQRASLNTYANAEGTVDNQRLGAFFDEVA